MKKFFTVAPLIVALVLGNLVRNDELHAMGTGTGAEVSCSTIQVENFDSRIHTTKVKTCAHCVWWTINASYDPEKDDASAKFIRNEATARASVQECEYHLGTTCTSVLLSGTATCPESAEGSPGNTGTGTGTGIGTGTGTGG